MVMHKATTQLIIKRKMIPTSLITYHLRCLARKWQAYKGQPTYLISCQNLMNINRIPVRLQGETKINSEGLLWIRIGSICYRRMSKEGKRGLLEMDLRNIALLKDKLGMIAVCLRELWWARILVNLVKNCFRCRNWG